MLPTSAGVMLRQSPRTFVESLDFLTSIGSRVGVVVTDLGILEPDTDGELELTRVHPGVSVERARAATAWDLKIADEIEETAPPKPAELVALRALQRTGRAPRVTR